LTPRQGRIEDSPAGRAALSLVIVTALVAAAIGGLPDSGLRRELARRAAPVLNAAGLDQRWDLFAPDPRRVSIALTARLSFADGTAETWQPPRRDAVFGAYSDYRWRKLAERVLVRGGDAGLARRIALWLARARSEGERRVVQVQVVGGYGVLGPPRRAVTAAYSERTLVTLRLPAAISR